MQWLVLLQSTGFRCTQASVVMVHCLTCSVACGIFPDQESNPYPLLWQADSIYCTTRKSPRFFFNSYNTFFKLFIYLFLAVLGLCCCKGFSLVAETRAVGGWPHCLVAVLRLLTALASLAVEQGPRVWAQSCVSGSRDRLSSRGTQVYLLCSMWDLPGAGILHWQADSFEPPR